MSERKFSYEKSHIFFNIFVNFSVGRTYGTISFRTFVAVGV